MSRRIAPAVGTFLPPLEYNPNNAARPFSEDMARYLIMCCDIMVDWIQLQHQHPLRSKDLAQVVYTFYLSPGDFFLAPEQRGGTALLAKTEDRFCFVFMTTLMIGKGVVPMKGLLLSFIIPALQHMCDTVGPIAGHVSID